jgi:uncharacterized protein (AIM24 family)
MPVLEIGLEANDRIVAEPGEFSWMTDNVRLNTTTQTAGATSIFGRSDACLVVAVCS